MKKFKTIGVLGGMGPSASAYFYQLLLTRTQKKFKAVQDEDYPPIIINSLALKGSNEFGMEENRFILDQLLMGIEVLEKAKADFIVIACNSVHNVYAKLAEATKLPIINLIEKVVKEVKINKSQKILIVSSETTKKYGLYNKLSQEGVEIIKPDSKLQKYITKLILSVMGGSDWDKIKLAVINQINLMYSKGIIDSVIFGCTELPLAIQKEDVKCKLYDSLIILADAALEFAENNKSN